MLHVVKLHDWQSIIFDFRFRPPNINIIEIGDRGIALVVRALAYHMICMKTQGLWVTPTPILHLKTILFLFQVLRNMKLERKLWNLVQEKPWDLITQFKEDANTKILNLQR